MQSLFKALILSALISTINTTKAQVTLEHSFEHSHIDYAKFISLETEGDKYFLFNQDELQLNIYNLDHSIYSSIAIDPAVIGTVDHPNFSSDLFIYAVSQHVFDDDDEVEFTFSFVAFNDTWTSNVAKTVIMNNDGSILYERENTYIISSQNEQFPKWLNRDEEKMLMSTRLGDSLLVYNLNTASIDGIIESNVNQAGFITLEDAGNKYYLYDKESLSVQIFNMDNTLYSYTPISPAVIGTEAYPNFSTDIKIAGLSQHKFDNDDSVEFVFSFTAVDDTWTSSITKIIVMNEDGSILFERNNAELIPLTHEQFPDWAELDNEQFLFKSQESDSLFVFSLNPITEEQTIVGNRIKTARYVNLEVSGTKYYLFDHENLNVKVYNLDHSIYSSINIDPATIGILGYLNFGTDIEIHAMSERVFDGDDELEFIFSFSVYDEAWENSITKTVVLNQDGSVLFEKSNAATIALSDHNFPGSFSTNKDKFILKGVESDSLFIYGLPNDGVSLEEVVTKGINIYPNPTSNYVIIDVDQKEAEFFLYTMDGKLVHQFRINGTTTINISNLTSGVYIYEIKSSLNILDSGKLILK